MTDKQNEAQDSKSEQQAPVDQRVVQAINNLQAQITFLYTHLGLTQGTPGIPSDPRRTETGMGAILNSRSDFV